MIRVQGLHKYFFRHKKNEIHVLNDMTIDFPDQGLVVLLGPSGSGKTTLLNVLGGLDNVQQGTIEFDNQILDKYDVKHWDQLRNESIGYIFQNYNLLPQLSVYDNIALVLRMMGISDPEIIEKRVHYILNAVNMFQFRKKKSTQLSGGQQQRVAIARALVKNPRVIIADEPTGNLDSKNTLDIMNIIKEISKQKLVVLVTHEKDIAKLYGDRIIEIKDGVIINDYENTAIHDHDIADDNIIYLKDLNQLTNLNDPLVNVGLFDDSTQELEPINVRLIIKNKTLYIDVDSQINKVKLIDSSSNLIIKDEKYVKKNREELFETSFSTDELDNKDVNRNFQMIVSIKQIFQLALKKILFASRKGKIMLFSFIVSGAVIALAVTMLAATMIPDLSSRMFEKNYINVNDKTSTKISYDDMMSYLSDDPDVYINTLNSMMIKVVDPVNPDSALFTFTSTVDIVDHSIGRLVVGRLPQADDEIVISSPLADQIMGKESSANFFASDQGIGAEYGIWNYKNFLYEQYRIGDVDLKVVGIVKTDIKITYMTRELTNLLQTQNVELVTGLSATYIGNLYADDVTLSYGMMPTGDQVIISRALFDELSTTLIDNTWPKTLDHMDQVVSGVFDGTSNIVIANNSTMEQLRYENDNAYFIYASDPESTLAVLQSHDVNAVLQTTAIIDAFNNYMFETRITMSIVSSIVVGFALLGFYFIMHSSMISRIYELSVYRALGMKKNELFVSFLVEILILSTITSLIGYLVATYGLYLAGQSLLGAFRLFLITPLTILIGLILLYLVNIIGGMIPILLLLRKTPAQILSQYDI